MSKKKENMTAFIAIHRLHPRRHFIKKSDKQDVIAEICFRRDFNNDFEPHLYARFRIVSILNVYYV